MTGQTAPNFRHSTLTSREHEMDGGEEHPPYTDALIKRAITKGLDLAGKPLDCAMPRWQMSESDLDDLVSYLKAMSND